MKVLIDCVAMTEDYHHELGTVDRIDAAIRWDPKRPNVPVSVELMNVKVRKPAACTVLE